MKSKSSIIKSLAVSWVFVAALCGCGGSHLTPSGRAVFVTSCNACHSLTGINTPRQQGGDLLDLHLSRAVLLQFAREMPVRHQLSQAELGAVVSYILAVQRRG